MEGIVKSLVSMGTVGSLFLAFLIIALAVLGTIIKANMKANNDTIAANNLAMIANLAAKDKRIADLEKEMKVIHSYIQNELKDIISENLRVMQKVLIKLNN